MSKSDGDQKISVQELKKTIMKSGYLIEQRVEHIIEKKGYYVQANTVFRDEETGKSREIDLEALAGIQIYRKGHNFLFPYIICECENNSQPVVFFQREIFFDFTFHYEVKCSGIPVKFWEKDGFVSLSEFMGLEKFHHYCKGPFSTQYCTFKWVKKKKSWIAKHTDEQHETFLSLIKSLKTIGICFLCLHQVSHNFSQFPLTDILEWTYHRKKDEVKDKTKKQNDKKSKKVSFKIDSSSRIGKKES